MIKLKTILSEISTDPKSVFGKIVFGDPDQYGSPTFRELQGFSQESEPNTEDEQEILNALETWVSDEKDKVGLYDKIYANYTLFKRAATIYPKIFKPTTPNGTELYRGLSHVAESIVEQLQGSSNDDFERFEHDDSFYKYKNPIKYTPRSNIQSWTTSPKIATEFSYGKRYADGVVLSTKQNDEYLFNPLVLQIIAKSKYREEEVIHFGKTFSDDIYISVHRKLYRKIIFGDNV